MRLSVSRNSACPCGSGQKYKRCCLAQDERTAQAAQFDDAVGRRIQDWTSGALGDEIGVALEDFVGPERTMDDDDIQAFAAWFPTTSNYRTGGRRPSATRPSPIWRRMSGPPPPESRAPGSGCTG